MAATTPDPVLSVIIPHHVGRHLLEKCLATVASSVGVSFEVLVITSDPTYYVPAPMEHWVQWYYVEGGPAHKRNVGVQHSRGKYLVFLDDDTELSPYTLYEFSHGFQALPQASMLFARIYNGERRSELDDCGSWLTPTGFLYARASKRNISHDELMRPVPCLASKSAGCAIRREAFYAAGGFDASYYILGEETDLAWRVWLNGGMVYYWPHAVLWHYFDTIRKPVADYYTIRRVHTYGCRNYLSLLWTNLGTTRLATIFPMHLLAWLISALGFTLRGRGRRGLAIMRGMFEFARNLPGVQRKRRQVQSTRVISDASLMKKVMIPVPLSYYPQRMLRYLVNTVHG